MMEHIEIIENRSNGGEQVTLIRPRQGWRLLDIKELWAYRELLWVLMMRDLKVRYKQTVMGVAWAVIQPVMTMLVFTIFFGHLARIPSDGYPYPVFLYAALLPWNYFANTVTNCSNSLVGSANLVNKIYFPRLLIPLTSVGAGLVDFAISGAILLILMLIYGLEWNSKLLLSPLLVLAVTFIALGVGTLLSALTVAYRDFRYVITFLIQLWMFVTPVVYPTSMIPERWQWVFYLNPMAGLIDGFRSAFLGRTYDVWGLSISFAMGIFVFFAGIVYFEKVERRFADII
jgi:lipopolysaccharide transport system permease protein